MDKKDVIDHFKSQVAVAKALGITRSAVSGWPDKVPPLRALQIEEVTGGLLKADRTKIYATNTRAVGDFDRPPTDSDNVKLS